MNDKLELELLNRLEQANQQVGFLQSEIRHLESKAPLQILNIPIIEELISGIFQNKIQVIKSVRTITGYELKESKELVEKCIPNSHWERLEISRGK